MGSASRSRAFLRLSRPHFLLGGALMFWLGSRLTGAIDPVRYALGQLMVAAGQLTAHYANEYADREVDRAVEHRTWFSGGSGVIPSGALRPEVALRAARISTGVTLAAAAGLAPLSLPAAALGVAALTVSWAYSMPPVRLLSTGWGEAAASIVVAGVVPAVGAAAQSGSVPDALWEVVAILIPLHLGMMLAFELPDLGGDASGGKRVLAVRIGRRGATAALGAAGIAAAVAAAALGYPWTAAVAAAGVPSMLAAARRGHHSALTTAAVATFLAAGVATAF